MRKFINTLKRLRRDEDGLTLVEYGVGAILAVGVGALALTALSGEIKTQLGKADQVMTTSGGTASTQADYN